MYGVKRIEKEEVLELIKAGVPQATLISLYKIPQTTISTWAQELRKSGVTIAKKNIQSHHEEVVDKRNTTKVIARVVNQSEAKIMTEIGKVISDDITDKEWFELQQTVIKELQFVATEFMKT